MKMLAVLVLISILSGCCLNPIDSGSWDHGYTPTGQNLRDIQLGIDNFTDHVGPGTVGSGPAS